MKYELKCRFCGKTTGQIDLPDNNWKDKVITNELLGIADTRCSNCEIKNGSYKEMHDEFLRDIGNHDEFLKMMAKTEFKKQNFDIEIAKLNEPILGSKLKNKPKSGIIKSNKK